MGLQTNRTALYFQSPGSLTPYTEIVSGGLPPYTASSSDTAVATVTQAVCPNLYPNSDTLSGSTHEQLTLANGGPNGAADAELTGNGSATGVTATLYNACPIQMSGVYIPSFWVNPHNISNAGNQFAIGLFDINLTQIGSLSQYGSGSAGRYAGAQWICPTNIYPNSDSLSGSWFVAGMALGTGGPNGAVDFEATGTGSSQVLSLESPTFTVSANSTVTFSAYVDPSHITGGSAKISVESADRSTLYSSLVACTGSAGRFSVVATIPAGVTSARISFQSTGTFTLTSGQKIIFSQPMVEQAPSASGYYISSQNPQVIAQAQLFPTAVIANGTKFIFSQPMLAKFTFDPNVYIAQTGAWLITPQYRGNATITYTDSTP